MTHLNLSLFLLILFILSGCAGTNFDKKKALNFDKASGNGRYSILQDHGPEDDVKLQDIPDLVPKYEPRSRGGNKSPYEVWGKKYWVMDSAAGFSQTGIASWYGKKFHGHKTSNGEIYDMYKYSAAHKSLPIPTYLRVTNLENGRNVIVRVNDRGPFHEDRIIDLSYAAAAKLDYHHKGVARVRIETVTPDNYRDSVKKTSTWSSFDSEPARTETVTDSAKSTSTSSKALPPVKDWRSTPSNAVTDNSYSYQPSKGVKVAPPAYTSGPEAIFTHLQVGAFSLLESAQRLKNRLIAVYDTDIRVSISEQTGPYYRVVIGPYEDNSQMQLWSDKLQRHGFERPVRVNLLP